MLYAVQSGHVPTAAWLHQAGCALQSELLYEAGLPMIRWLLEAGCPTCGVYLAQIVEYWPTDIPADCERLVEALQLLAAAGVPARDRRDITPLAAASYREHPWHVWRALQEVGAAFIARDVTAAEVDEAATTRCEATLEALAELGVLSRLQGEGYIRKSTAWYAAAAQNGDRSTLDCLRRLGVPMGDGVLEAAVERFAPLPALRWLVEHGAPWQSAVRDSEVAKAVRENYTRAAEQQEVEAWLRGLSGAPAEVA